MKKGQKFWHSNDPGTRTVKTLTRSLYFQWSFVHSWPQIPRSLIGSLSIASLSTFGAITSIATSIWYVSSANSR